MLMKLTPDDIYKKLQKMNFGRAKARRTTAEPELLAIIAPLGKLGWFYATADFFQINALHLAYLV